jgi:Cdc6-like AAA superfamily ATPase
VALIGEPGLGKTHAVKTAAERARTPFYYIECAPRVRGRQQILAMLRALDWPHDPTDSPATLIGDLAAAFASKDQVLALDEADRWGTEGVSLIRYLWSQPDCRTTIIFVGENIGQLIAANPALDSRIEHRVTFHPLDLDQTRQALRAYHRVFDVKDDRLLTRVHRLTHGQFRLIAILLRRVLTEADGDEPSLTSELLERAWRATGRRAP